MAIVYCMRDNYNMCVRLCVRQRFRVLIDQRNRPEQWDSETGNQPGQSDSETGNRPGQSDSANLKSPTEKQGEGTGGGGASTGGEGLGGGSSTGGGVKGGVFFFFFLRFFWVLPHFLGGGWSGVATGYLHSLQERFDDKISNMHYEQEALLSPEKNERLGHGPSWWAEAAVKK